MPPEGLLLIVETPTASSNDIEQLRSLGLVCACSLLHAPRIGFAHLTQYYMQSSRARHSKYTGLRRKASSTASTPTVEPEVVAASSEESGSVIRNSIATNAASDDNIPSTNRSTLRPADRFEHAGTSEHTAGKLARIAAEEPDHVDVVPLTATSRIHAGRSYKRCVPVVSSIMSPDICR